MKKSGQTRYFGDFSVTVGCTRSSLNLKTLLTNGKLGKKKKPHNPTSFSLRETDDLVQAKTRDSTSAESHFMTPGILAGLLRGAGVPLALQLWRPRPRRGLDKNKNVSCGRVVKWQPLDPAFLPNRAAPWFTYLTDW